ncbi:hypothetical protein [Pelagicoccus sp. SDUM812005]|uniref:tetratricopeptide repeat protein n=1 Tax=Pelagicoccus sp. SDUM812005 TaxID=3041257 RepID=UPI00280E0BC6|nr:hypothetical protein [Pelagicoccus sp. SDUM812005]MDQ8183165.1 hypothetical protein [Pelagicoccus sp. SDUM812005]
MKTPSRYPLRRVTPFALVALLSLSFLSSAFSKSEWSKASNEHFIIYSQASQSKTEALYHELNTTRALFATLFPALTGEQRNPLRVYIFKDLKSLKEIAPLFDGKPKDNPGFFSGDREGSFLCMIATGELDRIKHTLNHEYIHFITRNRGYYLAPWASEGLAELYSKIEYKKIKKENRILLGGVHDHRIHMVRNESLLDFDTFFRTTRNSDLYNGAAHGRSMLYSQAWLLFHYLTYGKHDLGDDMLRRLISLALTTPHPNEEQVKQTLGLDYKELAKRLRGYARAGRFTQRAYPIPAEAEESEIELLPATETETHLIYGSLLLKTRGPRASLSHLTKAMEADPQDPMVQAYNGYFYFAQKDYDSALPYFDKAIELGSISPATHLYHARCLLRLRNPKNKLNYGQYDIATSQAALASLHKALELGGPFSPEVYAHFGEVFLASRLELNDSDFSIVIDGFKEFPDSAQLAFYIALYFERTDRYDIALKVVERFASLAKNGRNAANFVQLEKRLLEKQSAASAQ